MFGLYHTCCDIATKGSPIPFAIGDVRLAVKRLRCTSIAAHTASSLVSATGGGQARDRRQEFWEQINQYVFRKIAKVCAILILRIPYRGI